ncbi:hypothetical protein ElyMa_005983700 [Elysia marginata]|uniref:Uncharacterized protein n=1 Tax=Elysia marginata TaxID=1093978 RepID=A0AAV4GFG8_9GAST|nr:hypothetical protein ElyMa_005983700 [Elysia marginata]
MLRAEIWRGLARRRHLDLPSYLAHSDSRRYGYSVPARLPAWFVCVARDECSRRLSRDRQSEGQITECMLDGVTCSIHQVCGRLQAGRRAGDAAKPVMVEDAEKEREVYYSDIRPDITLRARLEDESLLRNLIQSRCVQCEAVFITGREPKT